MTKTEKPKKEKKPKAPKPPKVKPPPPSEEEIVKGYVNRVIKNQSYHGRVDASKFGGLEHNKTVSKNQWMDSDFFFSVVFQSSDQKYAFLKAVGWPLDVPEDEAIQIVNGLALAKKMGVTLKEETTQPFPGGNLDLMPFVLDNEEGGQ
jgi:hypothetical protein